MTTSSTAHGQEASGSYRPRDGDDLEQIAARETQNGNPLTADDLARFNWGTTQEDTVQELMRDELGCRCRNADNGFVISSDDRPRTPLRIPRRFQRQGLATNREHTLRVRRRECPPQFLACCSIPGVTFRFDSSFVRPGVVEHLRKLETLARKHAEAKIMIFGHTDTVGSDEYNKALSERRARSVYAFVTNDADAWESLYQEEDWGVAVVQEVLLELGHDPGPIDGLEGPQTRDAMRSFQGLPPGATVTNNAAFRQQLFTAYMTGEHDVDLPRERFMEPRFMGCGEFNPLEPVAGEHEPNRRVTFFLFHPERLPNLPCALGDVAPCRRQMDPPSPRHHATFHCSFFDSLAKKCLCEGGGGATDPHLVHVSLLLRTNSGCVPIAGESYQLHLDDRVVDGETDDDGLLQVDDVPSGDYRLEIGGISASVPTLPRSVTRREFRIPFRYEVEA